MGLMALGCADEPTSPSDRFFAIVEPSWVVGAAAMGLGSDGRFDYVDPLPAVPGELSRDGAGELAAAAVRFVAGSVGGGREYVEQEHGALIDWARLVPCGRRVIPVWTNLSDPGESVPQYARTALGPEYQFEFCSPQGWPAVQSRVYVRSLARVRADGGIDFPEPNGDNFLVSGIPARPTVDLSPEYAVGLVFRRLGIRVAEIPEADGCLLSIPVCHPVIGRHWKMRLETRLRVRRASGQMFETDEVFTQAGYGSLQPGVVYIAAEPQPLSAWHFFERRDSLGVTSLDSVLVSIVRPIRLELFDLIPP